MLDQGCGLEASPTILRCHSCEQVKREIRDDNREVYCVDEISNCAGRS